jgi:hypothetical protein
MWHVINSRPQLAIHALQLIAASALVTLAGCGADSALPTEASEAAASSASAESASTAVAVTEGGSIKASLDNAVANYDRITTPAAGDAPLTATDIAAAQAAFDKVGDDLSKL